MARILKHDTNGTKGTLSKGEFGYDDYAVGGDQGRVYIGNGSTNIPLAKQYDDEIGADTLTNKAGTGATSLPNGAYFGGTAAINLLDDYENKVTWTPTANVVSFASASGEFFKIGDRVFATFSITMPVTADTSPFQIKSCPYPHTDTTYGRSGSTISYCSGRNIDFTLLMSNSSSTSLEARLQNTGTILTNAQMSGVVLFGVAEYTAS